MSDATNRYVKAMDRNQTLLLPETIDRYVGEENETRFIDAFVDSLDLHRLGFTHTHPNEEGRPPYHPADMLKLYIWGYLNQVRSSRKLERECHRNLEAIWLMRKLSPDYKTIADFRRDNVDSIKGVFKEFVKLCISLDLYGAKFVAIDGVKLKAVNSNSRNHNQETLTKRLRSMDEAASRYMDEMEALDREEEKGGARPADQLREKVRRLQRRRAEYAELLGKLVESGRKEVSLTDPDCRLMRSRGRLEPCYNVHVAVDDGSHLIVDYDVSNNSSDANALSPIAKAAKETLGVEGIGAAADKGFYDAEEIKECVDAGVIPYVPRPDRHGAGPVKKTGVPARGFYADRFVYDECSDSYLCPAGSRLVFRGWSRDRGKVMGVYRSDACFSCPFFMSKCTRNKVGRIVYRWEHEGLLEEMEERLRAEPWRMDARRDTVEHPFGSMKRAFNQGYLLLKGLRKVGGEVGFTMLAYNMRRALNILGTGGLVASVMA
ncbi:MAG: IS1182 family transposase [Candidatus Bathyarchaeia archaeon]